jgi:hypothetical protein
MGGGGGRDCLLGGWGGVGGGARVGLTFLFVRKHTHGIVAIILRLSISSKLKWTEGPTFFNIISAILL